MITFHELKNSRKESFAKITEKLNALSKPRFDSDPDPTLWQPTVDKTGTGFALIRLLPPPPGEEDAIVRLYRHAFLGPNGWYIENSLTTLGQEDPVSQMNNFLWKQGSEGQKFVSGDPNAKPKATKGSKRNTQYTANIYVVHDQGNPENDGKNFKWQFGPKLYAKIQKAETPEFPDVQSFCPFDLWEGATLKLKIGKQGTYRNYDQSEWDLIEEGNTKKPRGAFSATKQLSDEELERIWKAEYPLQEIIAPKHFKSYNKLLERLTKIMNGNVPGVGPAALTERINNEVSDGVVANGVAKLREAAGRDQTPPWDESDDKVTLVTGSELDEMEEFRRLAEEE